METRARQINQKESETMEHLLEECSEMRKETSAARRWRRAEMDDRNKGEEQEKEEKYLRK